MRFTLLRSMKASIAIVEQKFDNIDGYDDDDYT